MKVSQDVIRTANEAYARGVTLKETPDYEIFPVAPGFMDSFVLFLWREARDFPSLPHCLFVPVTLDGRRGYLIPRQIALDYRLPDDIPGA